jgi:hypothetical protein
MKQIEELLIEVEGLRRAAKDAPFTELRKIKKRIQFLEMCRLYLETKPREAFVYKQIESTKFIIETVDRRFGSWAEHRTGGNKALRRAYNSLVEINKLKAQLKTLKFIYD